MIENQHVRIWKEGQIMWVKRKVEEATPDFAHLIISTGLRGRNEETFSFPGFIRNAKTTTKGARSAFTEDDTIQLTPACALLVDARVNRLPGTFFLSISKPKVLTWLFASKEEAASCMNEFLNEKVSL